MNFISFDRNIYVKEDLISLEGTAIKKARGDLALIL
jgi:hypothetical protein